jgi:hypothetical protein
MSHSLVVAPSLPRVTCDCQASYLPTPALPHLTCSHEPWEPVGATFRDAFPAAVWGSTESLGREAQKEETKRKAYCALPWLLHC